MKRALAVAGLPKLDSIGIDTWGVDFALLGERGNLLENPFHYRDARTEGMLDQVCARVPREKIYSITGIQFLPFNTLFQLYADSLTSPGQLEATALGNIAMQMLAVGAASSLTEARRIIDRSFPVEIFHPSAFDTWDAAYQRFTRFL